jgi:hypothetical protein
MRIFDVRLLVARLSLLTAVVLTWGCQGSLRAGIDAFHHADYPLAAREFRAAAASAAAEQDSARFNLYAGLTHLALGNSRLAIAHLTQAQQRMLTRPSSFTKDERARLMSAWRALGKMPGEPLQP